MTGWTPHPPSSRRALVAACIGTVVEWYDFAIYGAFATVLASTYFPHTDRSAGLLASFAVFATAFLARPLGALLLGPYGDRVGRRQLLATAVVLMSLATAGIGLLPGYASIGLAAPLLLALLRLAQGLSAGGEVTGAAAFVVEHAPEGRRGRYGAWLWATFALGLASGIGVAAALARLLPRQLLEAWGWRLAFLVALPLGLTGLYLRLRVEETPAFRAVQRADTLARRPVAATLRRHPGRLLAGFSLVASVSLTFNTFFVFLPSHLVSALGVPLSVALAAALGGLALLAAAAPALGRRSDRVGRKPLLAAGTVGLLVLIVPAYLLIRRAEPATLALGYLLMGSAMSCFVLPSFLAELFPTEVRSTALALTYGLASALVGGTAPLVDTLLVRRTGNPLAPAWYATAVTLAAAFGVLLTRETAFQRWDAEEAPVADTFTPSGRWSSGQSPGPGDDGSPAAEESDGMDQQAGLSGQERAELERLRAEVASLRAQREAAGPASRVTRQRWRTIVAMLLIVVACVLAPLSVVAVWARNQVTNTDRYVATVAPLAEDPAIQQAITDQITTQVFTYIDVRGLTTQAVDALAQRGNLPPRIADQLQALAGPIANGLQSFTRSQVAKIVQSQAFADAWVQANRAAHQELVKALTGQGGGAITVENDTVSVNLAAFIQTVKQQLTAAGFTLAERIPTVNASFTVFRSADIAKVRSGFNLLNTLGVWLPVIVLVLLVLGVYVAKDHRRALVGAGLGVAAGMLLLALGLAVFRSIYLNGVPAEVLPHDAAAVLYDTIVRFLRAGLRTVLVLGLVVAAGAFLTGPSVTAVRSRQSLARAIAWLQGGAEHAGLRTGPVGTWVGAHKRALRIGAVVAASLALVFWSRPTGKVVIGLALALLVALAIIEFLGRPAEPGVEVSTTAQT